jgi:hypothetical protein
LFILCVVVWTAKFDSVVRLLLSRLWRFTVGLHCVEWILFDSLPPSTWSLWLANNNDHNDHDDHRALHHHNDLVEHNNEQWINVNDEFQRRHRSSRLHNV